jgi:hypothetical protein
MTVGRRAKASAIFQVGQPVIVTSDGVQFNAVVWKFKDDGKVRVKKEDGTKVSVSKFQLTPRQCLTEECGRIPRPECAYCDICMGINPADAQDEPPEPDEDPMKKGGREMSFVQYDIIWEKRSNGKRAKFFKCKLEDHNVEFYGWWRKSRNMNDDRIVYAIDIFAKRNGHDYTIESIFYDKNPIKDVRSLNADLNAAMNKFLHQTVNGHAEALDTLQAKARFPIIHIKRLRTIDALILKLKEVRDTGLRAGGKRLVEFKGDEDEGPTVRVFVDLTTQALVLKGKVPDLETGSVLDAAIRGEKGRKLSIKGDSKNVDSLIAELKKAKAENNTATCRKIRQLLRKLGHKGGSRTAVKKGK